MNEQMSLDFVTLFENDKVKVQFDRGELRVIFTCGDDYYQITHRDSGIEVRGSYPMMGLMGIVPTSGNVVLLVRAKNG